MIEACSRRSFLALAGAAALTALPAAQAAEQKKRTWPKMPDVPADFNAERCFEELADKGTAVIFPGPKDAPVVRMVFDTQCQWCVWQFKQYEPFMKKLTFMWHPVAVLNPWSELQGAAILSAKNPREKFLEHEAHFHDEAFKGLDVRGLELPFEMRTAVWENSKVFRRAGGISVPFGVLKTADGKYIALSELTTDKFTKLTGITAD